jgi:hypothetical protein
MGSTLSRTLKRMSSKNERRILLLGLDSAGKSTVLHRCLHVAWVCAPPTRWGYTPSQLTVSSQDPVWEGRPDDPDRGFRCPDCEVHEAHAKYLGTRDLAASFAHRVTFYRRMLGGRTSYGRTGDITSPDLRA